MKSIAAGPLSQRSVSLLAAHGWLGAGTCVSGKNAVMHLWCNSASRIQKVLKFQLACRKVPRDDARSKDQA